MMGTDDQHHEKKFPVIEIFGPTLQGEGSVIGYQTIFIRFGGCDYKCKQCDSLHAVLPTEVRKNATYMHTDEIFTELLERCSSTGTQWVTISGGNPLIHDLSGLVFLLKSMGIRISIETQGSYWRDWIHLCDAIVLSPKAPGMGEQFDPNKFTLFLDQLTWHPNTSIKIVCFSKLDLEFALEVFSIDHNFFRMRPDRPKKYISIGNAMPPNLEDLGSQISAGFKKRPEFSYHELLKHYDIMIEEVLQDKRLRDVVVLPQMHVMLWGNRQGV